MSPPLLTPRSEARRVLVVRLDSAGDVLLSGPAVRAVSGSGAEVVLLCSPRGRAAAALLPGVHRILEWSCPWIDPAPQPVRTPEVVALIAGLASLRPAEAVVLTSYHQSPLPTALLLRLAGVRRITAASTDYPGALLDVRLRPGTDRTGGTSLDEDLPEPQRALAIAAAAGYRLPTGDDGRLAVRPPPAVHHLTGAGPYLVLHPGADAPARSWPEHRCGEAVAALTAAGYRVLVTGSAGERALTARVAGQAPGPPGSVVDLGGQTGLGQLAGVLSGADVLIAGNTGPAHLAAAVGTPVVSLFAPVVPARQWAPYRVPHVLLGDQNAPCRGSRARQCPVAGHPCLSSVTAEQVLDAVRRLSGAEAVA
ncbi:MAG TPA: glycosyltransferase family 9 protein [Pseudonocardiaceae bacterium]|nr:glycosyltransferase family 9 protein [Pseudonocardiaceae bacterium]